MSDNPAGQPSDADLVALCERMYDHGMATSLAEALIRGGRFAEHLRESFGRDFSGPNPVGLPQEETHGGAPENGRADAATQPNLSLIAALLDHAELLIADETGSVVCWHEYTVAEALRSECAQCCVELARREMGHVASRSDASETAGPAVPGGGQPAPSEPEVPPGDGRAAGAPLEGIGPSGSLDAAVGGQPQQGEEAPSEAHRAEDARVRADAETKAWRDHTKQRLAERYARDDAAPGTGADSGGPTTTPAAERVLLAFTLPHKGHDGLPGAPEGVLCIRCVAERALNELVGALERAEREARFQGDRAAILSSGVGLARLALNDGDHAKAAEYLAEASAKCAALLERAVAVLAGSPDSEQTP